MKNTRKTVFFALLAVAAVSLAACEKKSETIETASSSVESESEYIENESVNENITTVSTYYEEPTPAEGTGDAEGFIPQDLPEGTIHDGQSEEALVFTEKGAEAYSVTITKAELTDRRSVIPGDEAEQVLLITYSYQTLNGEPRLVDDMSFRLFIGEDACEPYYVADQITGDVSTEEPVTAEICFAVPADCKEATLFVVDNTEEENENYRILLKF